MKEGDIFLASLPQANGLPKRRPVLFLREMLPFGDLLVCGITTQLHQEVPNFDELISPADADFQASGLKAPSLIRLGFLSIVPLQIAQGRVGEISNERLSRLRANLSDYLKP